MDQQRFISLHRAISTSLIVMPIQRKKLLARLETLSDEEADEIEKLLARANDIDWGKEFPIYENATQEAIKLYEQATKKLQALSPTA